MNQWHNAEVDPPEPMVEVLITDGDTIGMGSVLDGEWLWRDLSLSCGPVTHWMPMPDLPDDNATQHAG